MASKSFPIEVVASVYTGRVLCDSFSEVHHMVEHLMNGPVWTHQIPFVHDACKAEIRRQFPKLVDAIDERLECLLKAFEEADGNGEPRKSWSQAWIDTLVLVHGLPRNYEFAPIEVKGGA